MNVDIKKILLVEDNPNDAELTIEALKSKNLANDIIWLKDGQEAYTGREPINPVLILMDIKMPRVDGHQVLKQIKADPKLRAIPVVILTSSREEGDLLESYNHGVNAFVVKPVNFHDFMDSVSALGAFWVMVNEVPPIML
jgi:CheY-like chemotaxis protein